MSYHPFIHSSPHPYPKPTPKQHTRFTNIVDNCKYQSPLPNEFFFVFIVVVGVHIRGTSSYFVCLHCNCRYSCWRLEVFAMEAKGACVGGCRCWQLQVFTLQAIGVGASKCLYQRVHVYCWRLHVLALEARSVCIRSCRCLHWKNNIFMIFSSCQLLVHFQIIISYLSHYKISCIM